MPAIVLTAAQFDLYKNAEIPIDVCGPSGRVLGQIEPDFRPETAAEAERRMTADERCVPGELVTEMLRALDAEEARIGRFDKAYMDKFLSKWWAERRYEFPTR
jgi:hypothetical protein